MDPQFWHRRWKTNDIGFHKSEANPLLLKHFKKLSLDVGSRVFLPLCGKTRDISWLLGNGYVVTGVELSKIAVDQLFTESGLKPKISNNGDFIHYTTHNLDIFVGDMFDLHGEIIGKVDAVYDRLSLVALPCDMRSRYVEHLIGVVKQKKQLLICYEYDQELMPGPPFSITQEEIHLLYGKRYDITLVDSINVDGGLKGRGEAIENTWLLHPLPLRE
ncbi:MAG: thiopurine S-methyltransferase [Candidatus Endonucleobacter sp. (ex Gigantidas childressi)]|nr:thiopurine S-methyltransferase [Candidatus Endonucleobacter sp. (ex Gigantidas childressi)]